MTTYFELKDNRYPITLNYHQCIKDLPEKFGISLTKIFTDEEKVEQTMQALVLDDEKTIDLLWYYIADKTGLEFDQLLEQITGRDLERFRENFWEEVVNFFGPLKKEMLTSLWKEFKNGIKKADFENLTSNVSLSDSNPGE